jgi:PAS domain S-box-containing protein
MIPRFTLPKLNRTSLRIYITLLLLYLTLFIVLFSLANSYRSSLIEVRKREIRRHVEIALNTISPLIEDLNQGLIDRETALKQSVTLIRRMTYRSETMDNYIFMSGYDGTMLVQPLEPWLQGTNQLEAQDAFGIFYIKDLISTARSPAGEGYVTYYYPPPGSSNPGKKLSYVRGIPALECYIGTGMFYHDVDTLFREYLFSPIFFIVLSFLGISILITLYLRPLFRCFRILLDSFHTISRTPEEIPPVPVEAFAVNTDEHEILSGYTTMLKTLKESRHDLIRSEERYRQLYEESIGVRMVLDRTGMIVDVNSSFVRALGFSKNQMVGMNLEKFMEPRYHRGFKKLLASAFTQTYNRADDFDIRDSRGNLRTILFSESFLLPEDRHLALLTGVEITSRKQAEREAQLQKEQLIQADKLSSLGVLVAGVAHEINNPNQFILSSSLLLSDIWTDLRPVLDEYHDDNGDFLLNGVEYTSQKEMIPGYLVSILEGSRRIEKIVTDLKQFSRDEKGSGFSPLDVNEPLEAALRLCYNLAKNATDHLNIQITPDLPRITGNSQKLEQVFINLIQNACQALESRSEAIAVSSRICEDGTGLEIMVEDQGRGIDEANLSRIFDPFYTTNRRSGGTGLGLSISNTIIKDHRGTLTIESTRGEGTTARVWLPLITENES